jgi:hypothetical protein
MAMIQNEYERGDKVRVRFRTREFPARVIGQVTAGRVKVAMSLPEQCECESRTIPPGTPAFLVVDVADVTLLDRDPVWNPWATEPFMTREDALVITGLARTRSKEAVVHVGAYLDTASYSTDDPVWVWHDGWRRVTVVGIERGWIGAQFEESEGLSARSYQCTSVWPVICDFPQARTHVSLTAKQMIGRHLLCEESDRCMRPREAGCKAFGPGPEKSELPSWLRVGKRGADQYWDHP